MTLKLFIILFTTTIGVSSIKASTYMVGPGMTYPSPNALYLANVVQNGDTINIISSVYSGNDALANWSKDDLVIQGINGKPHMKANGQNLNGKAIWITSGDNIYIENIEFSECTVPDQNGAGIRAEGPNITIRNCYFHHNENGILTNNPYSGHVDIQYSEFAYNGYGDGYSHNLYVGHVSQLTFKFNYSHHAIVGHNLKSRAETNIILYNRIMDEDTGNSSRIIDISNGGFTLILGNLLMQGPSAINNNIIGYGLEGLSNPIAEVYIINNSIVNKRTASCIFISLQSGISIAEVVNNIFAGTGTIINGTTSAVSNNYTSTSIPAVQFIDENNYDYRLISASPAIDGGLPLNSAGGYELTPTLQYVHNSNSEPRISFADLDIGAYEYGNNCNSTYSTYFFEGGYNNHWENAANWDNGCIPPNLYDGIIIIETDCIFQKSQLEYLYNDADITIQNNATLIWK